jgi:hypothetical protein
MTTYNAENERAKRRYFTFQSEAKQRSEASIDAIAMALNRFEVYTRFKSFRAFRIEQAINFKNHLARTNERALEQGYGLLDLGGAQGFFPMALARARLQEAAKLFRRRLFQSVPEGYRHRQSRQRRTHSDTRSNSTRHRGHAFWNRLSKSATAP